MNDLNSDFVLWITLGALVLTAFSFVGFALKTFSSMEKDDDEDDEESKA
jgi:hypothetical protein